MEEFTFTYQNCAFTVLLSTEEFQSLKKDEAAMTAFMEQVYQNYQDMGTPAEENPNPNLDAPSSSRDLGSLEVSFDSSENSAGPKLQVATNKTKNDKLMWTSDNVKLLLDLRLSMEPEFNTPGKKKFKLWQKIQHKFSDYGYDCSYQELDTKYRNLLQTYKLNKEKQKKTGEGCIAWEFFPIFDQILGTKASVVPAEETLGSSLPLTTGESTSSSSSQDVPTKKSLSVHKLKRKKTPIESYLEWKKSNEEEKENRRDKKWQEKKELKEKELSILEKLASAMTKEH